MKKIVVKLPRETITAEGGKGEETEDGAEGAAEVTRPPWARVPLLPSEVPEFPEIEIPEVVTAEGFPPDAWRYHLPNTVDVFLPGKVSHD